MTWSYTGNPTSNEKDKYRFIVGDTNSSEPILQDEEISFILEETTTHYGRLAMLYESMSNVLSREIKHSLGPQSEDPTERNKEYSSRAAYYRKLATGLASPSMTSTTATFKKGMHDNV